MPKNEYTEKFEQFWKAYPRKTAKLPAFKAWLKHGIDDDAFLPQQVIQDVEKRTRKRYWPNDRTKIPHAATWINQARWEDEDWEDDIKSRGQRDGNGAAYVAPPKVIDTGPDLPWMETMCNRIMRNYLLCANGFSPERLQQFINTKKRVLRQMLPGIEEELANGNTKETRGEMAQMLGETLLTNLDHDLGLSLRHKVLKISRKRA